MSLVLVGGTLENCLIAWRMVRQVPDLDLVLLERSQRLGGDRPWSFHGGELSPDQHEWVGPLVAHSWSGHTVCFPDRERRFAGSYHTVTPERIHAVVGGALGDRVRLGVEVTDLAPDRVSTAAGETLHAEAVLDGRGRAGPPLVLRWRHYVVSDLDIDRPHGLDGAVPVDLGARDRGGSVVSVLPLDARRVLVEVARDEDRQAPTADTLRDDVAHYAGSRGWGIVSRRREAQGALPVLLGGELSAYWRDAILGVVRVGARAALFHPTTGQPLTEAVRLADVLAAHGPAPGAVLDQRVRRHSLAAWRRHGRYRMLNRTAYLAGEPAERHRVLERLHELPEPLIERFYSGRLAMTDCMRLMSGGPRPLPALRAALETRPDQMDGEGGR